MKPLIAFGICMAGSLVGGAAIAAGTFETGRAIYQARCAACHSAEFNGVGPAHKGVYGRRIGQAPGYEYSPALKAATGRWTEENLDRWLSDPEKYLPGQKMGINLDSAADRANVIEYLKSLSARE
jgi:cytochrome c